MKAIRTPDDSRLAGLEPESAALPDSTHALLSGSAAAFGERSAISFFLDTASHHQTEHWSYRRLFGDVNRFANLLHSLRFASGDVVATVLPNLPETHVTLWGGEAAGIVMPVNPLLEPDAMAALLRAAGARVLVTLAPFPGTDLYDKAAAVAAQVPTLTHVVLIDMAPHVPGLRRVAARALAWQARRAAPPMPIHIRALSWERELSRMPGDRLVSGRAIRPDDRASYFCTGGTTGLPKIAVRTHGQEVANAWMTGRMLGPSLHDGAALFCGLPLFHVNAVIATGLAAFLRGARVVLGTPQGFRAPGLVTRFWEIAAHHRIAGFSGVPTLLGALLDHPSEGYDLRHFRFAFSGAAPLSADLLRRFEERFGVAVVEGYGLTETACVAAMNPLEGEHRAGSVGIPLPLQDIRIAMLDADGAHARDAGTDEIGTVAIAGPNVFSGYLTQGHDTRLWIDRGDGRRWLNTGDLGRIDADGYLWLTGRAKDLIIRGGHNIDPAVIEEALQRHPDVTLVAAVGRPDPHAGEVPVAYVQFRPGATADTPALTAHAALTIGERAAIPKAIIIVDAMPLTAIGKIHKATLRLHELETVTRYTLDVGGVQVDTITAKLDPRHGSIVSIVAAQADMVRIGELLRVFAFKHECVAREHIR